MIIDLLEGLDHAVLRIEPLHLADELRIVHLRFTREDDAGADRLRLRLAIRQDVQVRIHRVRVSCKKTKSRASLILTRKASARTCVRVSTYLFCAFNKTES